MENFPKKGKRKNGKSISIKWDLFLASGSYTRVDFRNFLPSVAFSLICSMHILNPKSTKYI